MPIIEHERGVRLMNLSTEANAVQRAAQVVLYKLPQVSEDFDAEDILELSLQIAELWQNKSRQDLNS